MTRRRDKRRKSKARRQSAVFPVSQGWTCENCVEAVVVFCDHQSETRRAALLEIRMTPNAYEIWPELGADDLLQRYQWSAGSWGLLDAIEQSPGSDTSPTLCTCRTAPRWAGATPYRGEDNLIRLLLTWLGPRLSATSTSSCGVAPARRRPQGSMPV